MATQVKKPIKKAKTRFKPTVFFVASDMNVVLKLLIQNFEKRLISIFNQYPVFFSVFLAKFWRFFISYKATKWSVFLLVFSPSLGGFSSIKFSIFFLFLLIKFKKFFINWYKQFFSQFSTKFGKFFFYQSYDLKYYTFIRACVPNKK